MNLHQRRNFWPWACGLITCGAMTLGLAADGPADMIAAILLIVPSAVMFRKLLTSA